MVPIALANDLLEFIRARLVDFDIAHRARNVWRAAAASCRLVAFADTCRVIENDGLATASPIVRSAYEVHNAGLYALLGGNEAVDALIEDFAFHVDRFGKANRKYLEQWGDGTIADAADQFPAPGKPLSAR
jgi:hypothetical protein